MRESIVLLCGIGLLLQVADQVAGTAQLEIEMLTFKNSDGQDWNDEHCDGYWVALSRCDHEFDFCLDKSSSSDTEVTSCEYGKWSSRVFQDDNNNNFGYDMHGVANPIKKSFTSWPTSGIKFKVRVEDDDAGHSNDDLVDKLRYNINSYPKRTKSLATWHQILIHGFRTKTDKTSMSFKYRLYCDTNYYTTDCDVYCVAKDDDVSGHYTCNPTTGSKICRSGWTGSSCKDEIERDECLSDPCINGGLCEDRYHSYMCKCPPGFTGVQCQININECDSGPCLYGHCYDRDNSYVCTCEEDYVGKQCNLHVCDTEYNPCLNGASCGSGANGVFCVCTDDYTGENCETNVCEGVDCLNGGICEFGACSCPPGFIGSICDVDQCQEHPCHHGGICNKGKCECVEGYEGRYCELNIDDCEDDPCENDGSCIDEVRDYRCLCLHRYNGTNCEYLIPETPVEVLPEEEQPIENMTDINVPETDDQQRQIQLSTTTETIVPVPVESKPVSSGIATWIIALICVLLILIVLVVLIAAFLVKRYRRKARHAEDNAVLGIDTREGLPSCTNPVYLANPSPAGAEGPDPAVFLGLPPPYAEKEEKEPPYSELNPLSEPTKQPLPTVSNGDVMDPVYDNPRGAESLYAIPPSPIAIGDEIEEVPPLPMKQKDMGEQAPPLPDKMRM